MKVRASIIIIFASVIASAAQRNLSEVVRLRAVSDFPTLEEYYYSLYTRRKARALPRSQTQPQEPSTAAIRALIKKKICEKIFTSPLFQKRRLQWIDVDDLSSYVELFDRYQHIFQAIYKKSSNSMLYEYDNPYTERAFLYDLNSESDYMFLCPVKERRSQKIKSFYVSREYDVNLVTVGPPIAGRFVFGYDANDLILQAFAEESATESTAKHKARIIEYRYLKRRQNIENVTMQTDPVCRLTPSNKIRLCTSLFTSKLLRRKYKFFPTFDNVQFECERRQISFVRRTRVRSLLTITGRHNVDKNETYEEWVIGCRGELIGRSSSVVTYFVSRGKAKNTIFAYKEKFSDGRLFVVNYFKNVSVVDGIGNVEESSVDDHEASVHDSGDETSGDEIQNA